MQEKLFSYIHSSPSTAGTGPLTHRSIAIQPNMSVRGWPCRAGSMALENYVALEDATVIESLRTAGASIPGYTHMSELGFGLDGDTAAQAMVEKQCDALLATDTLGEARHTACQARLFGFKASYGLISRFGLIGLIPSMESCGVVAQTPQDIAEIMTVLAVPDPRDPSMFQDKAPNIFFDERLDTVKTIGVIRECTSMLPPTAEKAFQSALSRLEKTGVRIQVISLSDYEHFRAVHNVIGSTEASSSAGKYDSVRYGHRTANTKNWNEMYCKSREESFGVLVKSYLFQGAYFQFNHYPAFEKACQVRRRLVEQTKALFNDVDLIASPTQCLPPSGKNSVSVDDVYTTFALTLPANVTGQPALHIPGFVMSNGADLGLQLTAARRDDGRLLSFAARLA